MARVKYYDSTTQTWKYADMALQTGIHVGTTAPTNEAMLWVDTASNQIDSFPLTDVQDSEGNSLIVNQIAVIPTVPNGTNNGDMLVWDGDEWVSKPKWQMIYQPVEYIESTGTQRIDTGLTGVDGIAIDLQNTSLADGYGVFGVCSSNNNTRYDLYYWSGLYFCTSNNNVSTNTLIDNLLTRSSLSHGVTDNVLRINEVEIATLIQTTSPTNINFNLFARAGYNSGTEYKYGKARIYSCTLYISQSLVRNYIPVRNVFTGEGGLYDLANNKFYGNKGTGDFVIGPDVN